MKTDPRLAEALHLLSPPPGTRLWFGGPSLLGSLRGVSHRAASWRPAPGRHSIWDLTLHLAYWKYAARRRLEGGPRGGFPRSPANFPLPPEPATAPAWKKDRALLAAEHEAFVAAARSVASSRLDRPVSGKGTYRFLDLVFGVATHDVHHVGQIQLLKRLYRERG